jgi:hypothetical protein
VTFSFIGILLLDGIAKNFDVNIALFWKHGEVYEMVPDACVNTVYSRISLKIFLVIQLNGVWEHFQW